MDIKVNGEVMALAGDKAVLRDVLAAAGIALDQTGIAVAVNMELIPRGEWLGFQVNEGDEVEIITARQGG